MRNFLKAFRAVSLVTIALIALCLPARAQVDFYAQPRWMVLDSPRLINQAAGGAAGTNAVNLFSPTNDMHGCDGIAGVYICWTNAAAYTASGPNTNQVLTALAVTLQNSVDATNWTTMTNVSFATNFYFPFITNGAYGGTNLVFTNQIAVPGTLSTATPSSAGFAGTYLVPSLFTNTATITNQYGGVLVLGVPVFDSQRYWRVNYQTTNTIGFSTNGSWFVSAIAVVRRANAGAYNGFY